MVKISDAELEVMKIIWKRGKTTSVEIIEELKEIDDISWNYNTIRTLIKRLLVKGAIEVVKKEGKTYTYKAIVKENEYKTDVVKKLLKKLFEDSISELVVQYCEAESLSINEMKELCKKIDEMIDKRK